MHYHKFLILFVFFYPVVMFAQSSVTDITGLWKGTLYNDSTKQDYKYEIGISEEKGKLNGFSHTWYNDSGYYVIKKVKIKRSNEKIIIEDVDILSYNYPEKPPKGVRRLHVLTLQIADSILILSGPFTTNRTKEYTAATGNVTLQRKNDFRQSALLAHLDELKLTDQLSFVPKVKEIQQPEIDQTLIKKDIVINNIPSSQSEKKETILRAPDKKRPQIKTITLDKSKENQSLINSSPAAAVDKRKNILMETVYFKSDSLQLSLYDNGEIDGDTVSVLLNGKIIIAKQRLTTNAVNKTIYVNAQDSIQLVMYAENLGSLPPNTGLLVVRDGKENYEIRFSGDLQKNAAIVLKRRKN